MKDNNAIVEKSFRFSLRIIKMHDYLLNQPESYTKRSIYDQLLRCGTSIGANINEAAQAQSKADFAAKLSIALKEASETNYWIKLLRASGKLSQREAFSIQTDCIELIRLLTAILKTTRNNLNKR